MAPKDRFSWKKYMFLGNSGHTGWQKGLYSLYRKMCRQQSSLEAIMDRISLQIIVTSVQECYHVLGLLHTHFRPILGAFDDYIGLPKASGYQSLHTCSYPVPHMSSLKNISH